MPVLHLIVSAAPPAQQVPEEIANLAADGWDVWVTCTPNALAFLDRAAVERTSGHPVRVENRTPGTADPRPPADAVAAAPVTLNTLAKWALGINDNSAVGTLHEVTWVRAVPVVAGVWAKDALRAHPEFDRYVARLDVAGVRFLPYGSGYDGFDWAELRTMLADTL